MFTHILTLLRLFLTIVLVTPLELHYSSNELADMGVNLEYSHA